MKILFFIVSLIFSVNASAQDSISRIIQLNLGSMDKLPPGALVSFKVHSSVGELDPSKFGGRGEFTKDDISSRDLVSGDISYSEIVQVDGLLPSKVFPIELGKVSASSVGGKKSLILFEVDVLISKDGSTLFEKTSTLPFIIQPVHRDNIPVCISVFHRVVPSGQISWGISRHSCEQPLELEKKKSFKKQ
jgi:hypothetical protein